MKFIPFNIFVLFFLINVSYSQKKSSQKLIDSIQKNILNKKVKDSIEIADAHYQIGEVYRYQFLGDSAYYHYIKAEKIYEKQKNKLKTAKTLYGIAAIQCNEKDFTGCEVTSIQAIKLLESLKETNDEVKKYKSFIFNNLGLALGQLEQYEESISYHIKSLNLKKKLKGNKKSSIENTRNNLALSYKMSGQYALALEYFSQLLENENLIHQRPEMYALVLDNYAHTLYLSGNLKELPFLYLKALKIVNKENPKSYFSIAINQHLAEYYKDHKKMDSAKYYAYQAKEISENYHIDEFLSSLLLLSKIEKGETAAKHLRKYIRISDSVQKSERKRRNKFARIQFETEKLLADNIRIAKERSLLLMITVVLVMLSLLLYVLISQRNKNKELQFTQQQQKSNEEIYNLMLTQSESIEEARTQEKKRISEELHDGVLGRLFGTRLSLDSLNMNSSTEAVKTRGEYIEQLKTIEEDIRKVSHQLNTDFISGSGFTDIIQTLVETQTQVYKLKYRLNSDDVIQWDDVSNKNKIHIYRILQETLHNIHKHAEASLVNISFKLKNNVICLSIIDDGVGFDTNKMKSGIGLKNINSRIKEINGVLNIRSEKNVGTTLEIEVPIN